MLHDSFETLLVFPLKLLTLLIFSVSKFFLRAKPFRLVFSKLISTCPEKVFERKHSFEFFFEIVKKIRDLQRAKLRARVLKTGFYLFREYNGRKKVVDNITNKRVVSNGFETFHVEESFLEKDC